MKKAPTMWAHPEIVSCHLVDAVKLTCHCASYLSQWHKEYCEICHVTKQHWQSNSAIIHWWEIHTSEAPEETFISICVPYNISRRVFKLKIVIITLIKAVGMNIPLLIQLAAKTHQIQSWSSCFFYKIFWGGRGMPPSWPAKELPHFQSSLWASTQQSSKSQR